MHHLFGTPQVFTPRVDLNIETVIVIVPVQGDAVAREAAGDKTMNGLVGGLSGRKGSGGDSRAWHLCASLMNC